MEWAGGRKFFVKVNCYVVSGTFTGRYDLFFTELRQASSMLELRVAFGFDLNINITTHNIGNKDIQTSGGCATSTCNRNSRTGNFGNWRSYKLSL